jgi:hypothetical protein
MINTIIAYDNADTDLGDFFEKCATNTKENADSSFNILEINSQSLNDFYLQLKTDSVNENVFLFISYTHGSDTELLKNGKTPFISDSINVSCLRNGIAYCFACNAGKKLGQALIDNGAIAFVGFKDEVKIQKFFNAFHCFIDCATSGIIFFLNGEDLANSIVKMKEKYTLYLDQFYLTDMIIASWFMEQRDSLVLLGNQNISVLDFQIE